MSTARTRLIALLVSTSMLAGCSGSDSPTAAVPEQTTSSTHVGSTVALDTTTTIPSPSTSAPPPEAVVPPPPPPAAITGATPSEQAASLDQSVATGAPNDATAGWLAAYDTLGVPVLGADGLGIGTTGDDPIGPPFAAVWMLADTSTLKGGLPLTDVVRMYIDDDQPSGELAEALLADLRAAAVSVDPKVALFGHFVRQRALRGGSGTDLLDPATLASDVYLDGATAQLITWAVIRAMTAVAAVGQTSILGFRSVRSRPAVAAPASSSTPCSEAWGDEDTTYWVNWLANKIGAGTQLPGMEAATKGLIEKLSQLNPSIISSRAADRVGKVAKVANLVTGLLSLILSVSALEVAATQEPDPFERNKRSSQGPGKTTEITWVVRINIGDLPDGNQKLICAASFLLNTLGIGFSLPASAELEGVDVTFEGRVGFGERLNTADAFVTLDANELKMTSKTGGLIHTTVTGKAQKKDFPDSARKVIREFSIDVAAQVEPENLNSLLNVFFDGLSFGVAPDAYGLAAGAIDIAKTLHWDLGEYTFRMYDWQAGWKIDQNSVGYHFTGIVCDTDKPFTVDGTSALAGAGGTGVFTIVPTDGGPATWTFSGSMGDGAFGYNATGTGAVDTPENAEAILRLDATSSWMATTPAGDAPLGEHFSRVDLVLVPLETDECTGE